MLKEFLVGSAVAISMLPSSSGDGGRVGYPRMPSWDFIGA